LYSFLRIRIGPGWGLGLLLVLWWSSASIYVLFFSGISPIKRSMMLEFQGICLPSTASKAKVTAWFVCFLMKDAGWKHFSSLSSLVKILSWSMVWLIMFCNSCFWIVWFITWSFEGVHDVAQFIYHLFPVRQVLIDGLATD